MSNDIPAVSYEAAKEAVRSAVEANVPILLWGSPGVGKTALIYAIGKEIVLPPHVVIGSACDPTDIGGFPIVGEEKDSFIRIPMREIRECIESPGLLFLDELTCCPPAVQSTLLRAFLERVVGDFKLHPGTRIVAAANPPEQAPGATEVSAALAGRIVQVRLTPSFNEIQKFFSELGRDQDTDEKSEKNSVSGENEENENKTDSRLREEATEFSLVLGVMPNLLEIDPPQASVTNGAPWGAPRNWERAVRCLSRSKSEEGAFTVVAGCVGSAKALEYINIRKMRKDLPSIAEIIASPSGAMVPQDRIKQLAALGLLARVAEKDIWAAWVYCSRLNPEIASACARILVNRKRPKGGKNFAEGEKAFRTVLARIGNSV